MSSVAVRPGKSCPTRSSDEVCDLNGKRGNACVVSLSDQPPLSCCSNHVLECVSDFNSIDILLSLERKNPACSFLACSPRCLLVIFTPSSAKFHTGNTHTHLSVFKAHRLSCLIQSSVSVCGRAFWIICTLLDYSQDGQNGPRLRNHNEKQERRYLKKSRRWKG